VLTNLTYTFFDVKIVHEGIATSEFFVLGKLQQPQRMNSLNSRTFYTAKKITEKRLIAEHSGGNLFLLLTQNG
jgi:hypothetical protein